MVRPPFSLVFYSNIFSSERMCNCPILRSPVTPGPTWGLAGDLAASLASWVSLPRGLSTGLSTDWVSLSALLQPVVIPATAFDPSPSVSQTIGEDRERFSQGAQVYSTVVFFLSEPSGSRPWHVPSVPEPSPSLGTQSALKSILISHLQVLH